MRSAECGTRNGEWKKNDLQPLFVDSAFRAPRSTIGDTLKAGQCEMKNGPWASVGARANPPSVFLDGNTWRSNSPSVSKRIFVGEMSVGAAIMLSGVRITYTQTWQTPQFNRQRAGMFNFGSLSASVRF